MHINDDEIDIIIDALKNPDNGLCQQRLLTWMGKDAAKKRLFNQLQSSWALTGQLKEFQRWDDVVATERFKERLSRLITANEQPFSATIPAKRVGMRVLKWTAGIAAFLALACIIWVYQLNQQPGYLKIATADKKDTVQLADGTFIYLNAHTAFKYPKEFNDKVRKVELEKGEIFLEVYRNEKVPFIVETGQALVEVLGTTFNVKNIDSMVRVQVNSGKVAFQYQQSEKVLLTPGMAAELDIRKNTIKKINHADPNVLAWKTHTLVFEKAPMSKVVKELANYYGTDIDLQTDTTQRLTSTFENKELDEVLEIIAYTLNLKITKENDQIIIDNK